MQLQAEEDEEKSKALQIKDFPLHTGMWLTLMIIMVFNLSYQYFATLGLAPGGSTSSQSATYLYSDFAANNSRNTALLRWLFLPPLDDGVRFEDGTPKLPSSWSDSTVIYGDFALALAISLQLTAIQRLSRAKQHVWSFVAVESKIGTTSRRLKRFLLLMLPWLTDLFLLMACVVRNDLICILYLVVVTQGLVQYRRVVTDRVFEWRTWKLHLIVILITLGIRFTFILPAGTFSLHGTRYAQCQLSGRLSAANFGDAILSRHLLPSRACHPPSTP